jgi:hypothetical protein
LQRGPRCAVQAHAYHCSSFERLKENDCVNWAMHSNFVVAQTEGFSTKLIKYLIGMDFHSSRQTEVHPRQNGPPPQKLALTQIARLVDSYMSLL